MRARTPGRPAYVQGRRPGTARALIAGIWDSPIGLTLGSVFNVLVLNLVFLASCVFVVTIPVAMRAAMVALDKWRDHAESRVVREFASAWKDTSWGLTTIALGAPLLLSLLAVSEVHYFVRGTGMVSQVCLGLGLAGLLLAVTTMGYVLYLLAQANSANASPVELWNLSISLALRNIVITGPLFLVECVGTVLVALLDPAVLLAGLGVGMLWGFRVTARLGLRNVRVVAQSPGETLPAVALSEGLPRDRSDRSPS